MSRILLVGGNPASLTEFAGFLLRKNGIRVSRTSSGEEALAIIGSEKVDTVIVEEKLADGDGMSFVRQLTKVNPLINCALISPLSLADFHEATEGLGVFMHLPVDPGAEHAEKMLQLLESIETLMSY
ncbi:MAG: response regulator receiver protein [uncultured bacterium]|nr:MAG: response regulator receiver protein [uncultured bacterium]